MFSNLFSRITGGWDSCSIHNKLQSPEEKVTSKRHVGRRTGRCVIEGKMIRINEDGTENYDDYWTDHNTTGSSSLLVELSNCTVSSTSPVSNSDDDDSSVETEQSYHDTENTIPTTPFKTELVLRKQSINGLQISDTPIADKVEQQCYDIEKNISAVCETPLKTQYVLRKQSINVLRISDTPIADRVDEQCYDTENNLSTEQKTPCKTQFVLRKQSISVSKIRATPTMDEIEFALKRLTSHDTEGNGNRNSDLNKFGTVAEKVYAAATTTRSELKSTIQEIEDNHVMNINKCFKEKRCVVSKEVDSVEPVSKSKLHSLVLEAKDDRYLDDENSKSITEKINAAEMMVTDGVTQKSTILTDEEDNSDDNDRYSNEENSCLDSENDDTVEPVAKKKVVLPPKRISKLTSHTIQANTGRNKILAVKRDLQDDFTRNLHAKEIRKSQRNRVAPLAHWRNQRQKMRYLKSGDIICDRRDEGTKEDRKILDTLMRKQNQRLERKFHCNRKKITISNPETRNREKVSLHKPFKDLWSVQSNQIITKTGCTLTKTFSCGFVSFGFLKIDVGGKKNKERPKDNIHFTLTNGHVKACINNTHLMLWKNDSFIVPLGNSYSLQNCGKTKAVLAFCRGSWPAFSDQNKNKSRRKLFDTKLNMSTY